MKQFKKIPVTFFLLLASTCLFSQERIRYNFSPSISGEVNDGIKKYAAQYTDSTKNPLCLVIRNFDDKKIVTIVNVSVFKILGISNRYYTDSRGIELSIYFDHDLRYAFPVKSESGTYILGVTFGGYNIEFDKNEKVTRRYLSQ